MKVEKSSGPRPSWVPEADFIGPELWARILEKMPMPCMDVIFENADGRRIIWGWRTIPPYKDVWALPGGRLLKEETLVQCSERYATLYGMTHGPIYLNGVFPVTFPEFGRSDISVSVAVTGCGDALSSDLGRELTKLEWKPLEETPSPVGENYARMVEHWKALRRSPEALALALVSW